MVVLYIYMMLAGVGAAGLGNIIRKSDKGWDARLVGWVFVIGGIIAALLGLWFWYDNKGW